jgi:hypothetical protein
MKIKTTLAVIALTLAPSFAFAQCSGDKMKEVTAASCVPGAVWDEAKGACVINPTS